MNRHVLSTLVLATLCAACSDQAVVRPLAPEVAAWRRADTAAEEAEV